jgi:hypothetical protein
VSTLETIFPVMSKYIIGLLPIFFAYAFFGICFFWPTGYFSNTIGAMTILYAVINGDTVFDMASANSEVTYFFGMLYSYSFIVLFICVV